MSDQKDQRREVDGDAPEEQAAAAREEGGEDRAAPDTNDGSATRGDDRPSPPAAAATTTEPAGKVAAAPAPAPAPRSGSSGIGWLALVLVLVLAGAAVWSLLEAQRREAALLVRVAMLEEMGTRVEKLEDLSARKEANLDQRDERLRQDWRDALGDQRRAIDEQRQALSAQQGALQELRSELAASGQERTAENAAFEERLGELRSQLARYTANDGDAWLLAEAEYLLRLANQRLVMSADTEAARALLGSADDVLRQLEDASLHEVRGAVAADLAAVRAVPTIDLEGLYLRLAALIEQVDRLVIFQFPEQEQQPREAAAEDWQGRLRQGYEDALAKLSDYIIIRRRDVPMQALMDPQWEGLVRQNLRMLLEQAQVALLSGNQGLYRESLQRAQRWVAEFFESDESAARAMDREIAQLADATVAVAVPDVTRSLKAMDDALAQRLREQGEG